MTTSAKKTKKVYVNSTVNQEIKGRFVARDVKALFSYEMEAILRASDSGSNPRGSAEYPLPGNDDIENMYEYKCPECGEGHKEETNQCDNCKHISDIAFDSEPQEIFEWWIVTEWLYDKLKEKGEPVLEWGNNWYWGRTTTGQAILLDSVISGICSDMEILDGQKNSWANNT